MKIIVLLILLTITNSLIGQINKNDLIGEWKYEDIYEREKVDERTQNRIEEFFGSMTKRFDDQGNYEMNIMGIKETGKWKIENDTIMSLASRGNINYFEIVRLNVDTFIYRFDGTALILTKVDDSNLIVSSENERSEEIRKVKVTKEQVAKTWSLNRVEYVNEISELLKQTNATLMEDNYLELQPTGEYNGQIYNLAQSGTWKLGDKENSIVTMIDGSSKEWTILGISENELILALDINKAKWIFTSVE